MTSIVMVAARARGGVIGRDGHMPWHLPGDFAHFKKVTLGHPLVMGRTTFESIGRPLPGRQSIVLTRDPAWSYDGVLVAQSVGEAIRLGAELDDIVSIGGGGVVYAEAMPHATHQILTEIDLEVGGDTLYPAFDESAWEETAREDHRDDVIPWEARWLRRR
jgi:dihydrofolate reductase